MRAAAARSTEMSSMKTSTAGASCSFCPSAAASIAVAQAAPRRLHASWTHTAGRAEAMYLDPRGRGVRQGQGSFGGRGQSSQVRKRASKLACASESFPRLHWHYRAENATALIPPAPSRCMRTPPSRRGARRRWASGGRTRRPCRRRCRSTCRRRGTPWWCTPRLECRELGV